MKKTLMMTAIALLASAGMVLNTTAQETGGKSAVPAAGMKSGYGYRHNAPPMTDDLNLTNVQKAQVQDIMTKQREATHARIIATLTPEQQRAFDAQQGQRRGGASLAKDLNLSEAQEAQMRDIMKEQREETRAKVRAILTPEQQKTFDARAQQRSERATQPPRP
ncbi:MAG: hypothetical protein LBB65_04605 [Burkholderiales bacterium]|nr:hypothetical protein [Burkholderiales bacterium]